MKHILRRVSAITLILFLFCPGSARDQQPSSSSLSQDNVGESTGDDPVYTAKEVNKKAKITNMKKLDPSLLGPSSDCPNESNVALRVILRKSGEVTDIKILRPMRCSFDEKAVKTVKKIKFTPAIKDGAPVSQYLDIEYRHHIF